MRSVLNHGTVLSCSADVAQNLTSAYLQYRQVLVFGYQTAKHAVTRRGVHSPALALAVHSIERVWPLVLPIGSVQCLPYL